MKKLLGSLLFGSLCLMLSLGSAGCGKTKETPKKDKEIAAVKDGKETVVPPPVMKDMKDPMKMKDVKTPPPEIKDAKEPVKDAKEPVKDAKEPVKDAKEPVKDAKEPVKDAKEPVKDAKEPVKDGKDTPPKKEFSLDKAEIKLTLGKDTEVIVKVAHHKAKSIDGGKDGVTAKIEDDGKSIKITVAKDAKAGTQEFTVTGSDDKKATLKVTIEKGVSFLQEVRLVEPLREISRTNQSVATVKFAVAFRRIEQIVA